MLIRSESGNTYDFPHYSSTLEGLKNFGNIISIPFDNKTIEEIINISQSCRLSENAFRLISFLDLIYLLYNYNIGPDCAVQHSNTMAFDLFDMLFSYNKEINLRSNLSSIQEYYEIINSHDWEDKLREFIIS